MMPITAARKLASTISTVMGSGETTGVDVALTLSDRANKRAFGLLDVIQTVATPTFTV
jgi:hypothetical protein